MTNKNERGGEVGCSECGVAESEHWTVWGHHFRAAPPVPVEGGHFDTKEMEMLDMAVLFSLRNADIPFVFGVTRERLESLLSRIRAGADTPNEGEG